MTFSAEIQELLKREHIAYVSTLNTENNDINISIKAIIDYENEAQKIYFLDMFEGITRNNLISNPRATIAIADLKNFCAYQFKGNVKMINSGEVFEKYTANWNMVKQNRFRERVSQNLTRSIIGSLRDAVLDQPADEYDLPKPKYVIELSVDRSISLSPFKKH